MAKFPAALAVLGERHKLSKVPALPLRALRVEPMNHDILTLAACMVIDADVFPHASVPFGVAIRQASFRAWVARYAEDRQVIGFLVSFLRRRVLHVVGLAVTPGERRRGAGRALLQDAKSVAEREGAESIVLEVSSTNAAAVRLYRSEGFVVSRLRRDFYSPGVYASGRDAFEMVLRLEP